MDDIPIIYKKEMQSANDVQDIIAIPAEMVKEASEQNLLLLPSRQNEGEHERIRKIQQCIQSLIHACRCSNILCNYDGCSKMKRVVFHTKNCTRKVTGGCPICRELIALICYHARQCNENRCSAPFCPTIKRKIQQQRENRARQMI